MNLPNKLTLSRILLAFLLMLLVFCRGVPAKIGALAIFLVASLTDFYDGHLARTHGMMSDFGRLMDPIADKILVISAFLAFVELRIIPAWMVVLIIARELLITGLRLLAAAKGIVLTAAQGGKHKTVSQMLSIIVILAFLLIREIRIGAGAWEPGVALLWQRVIWYGMLVTITITVGSGLWYLWWHRAVWLSVGSPPHR